MYFQIEIMLVLTQLYLKNIYNILLTLIKVVLFLYNFTF